MGQMLWKVRSNRVPSFSEIRLTNASKSLWSTRRSENTLDTKTHTHNTHTQNTHTQNTHISRACCYPAQTVLNGVRVGRYLKHSWIHSLVMLCLVSWKSL